jgi:hypothetical protein
VISKRPLLFFALVFAILVPIPLVLSEGPFWKRLVGPIVGGAVAAVLSALLERRGRTRSGAPRA